MLKEENLETEIENTEESPEESTDDEDSEAPIFQCSSCSFLSDSKSCIIEHVNTSYKCSFCDYRVTCHRNNLRKHINSVHRKELSDSKKKLKSHIDIVFGEKISEGSYNYLVVRKNDMIVIREVHMCSLCGYECDNKSRIQAHITVFHKSQFKCNICDFQTYSKINISLHKLSSHGKITCKMCDCTFKSEINLRKHVQDAHFACIVCSLYFSSKSDFEDHMHEIHGNLRFRCAFCNNKYLSKSSLEEHIDAVHVKGKRFSCSYCDRKFSYTFSLRNHINAFHRDVE